MGVGSGVTALYMCFRPLYASLAPTPPCFPLPLPTNPSLSNLLLILPILRRLKKNPSLSNLLLILPIFLLSILSPSPSLLVPQKQAAATHKTHKNVLFVSFSIPTVDQPLTLDSPPSLHPPPLPPIPPFPPVHEKATVATPLKLQQTVMTVEAGAKLDVLWSFLKTHLKGKILVFLSSCKQVGSFEWGFTAPSSWGLRGMGIRGCFTAP